MNSASVLLSARQAIEKKHLPALLRSFELLESLMLSCTSVLEDCLSMATMISAISAENSGEAIKRLLAVIVEHAGGDFVGIQGAQPQYGLPAYVLFNHPKHGSTLALRLDQNFGTDAIRNRLAACDRRYSS
jgi:hypothetical protein